MRNLLALTGLTVLIVVGVGWYLGWYHVQAVPTSDGHREFTVDINQQRIKEDVQKAKAKLQGTATNNIPAPQPPPGTPPAPPSGPSFPGYESSESGTCSLPGSTDPSAPQPSLPDWRVPQPR
jgi:hypothetical protein